MILVNQEGNYSIKVEDDISTLEIEYDYKDDIRDIIDFTSMGDTFKYRMLLTHKPYDFNFKKETDYKKALEEYETRKKEYEENKKIHDLKRKELLTSPQYYKVIVGEKEHKKTFGYYVEKETAYNVFADIFKAYGSGEKVFTLPKDSCEQQ